MHKSTTELPCFANSQAINEWASGIPDRLARHYGEEFHPDIDAINGFAYAIVCASKIDQRAYDDERRDEMNERIGALDDLIDNPFDVEIIEKFSSLLDHENSSFHAANQEFLDFAEKYQGVPYEYDL